MVPRRKGASMLPRMTRKRATISPGMIPKAGHVASFADPDMKAEARDRSRSAYKAARLLLRQQATDHAE